MIHEHIANRNCCDDVDQRSPPEAQVARFREGADIYPRRSESRKTGRRGYQRSGKKK